MELKMNRDQLVAFLSLKFPQIKDRYSIDCVEPCRAVVSTIAQQRDLRPGGTVSGPVMFALADMTFYVAVLGMIGPEALTVTTNANINFIRKPSPGRLIASARILKLGRSLCVGDVMLRSETSQDPVAQATMTYSIPPIRDKP